MFFRDQTARAIESALTEGCCRVQRTMPADLPPTPGYLAMNSDPLGIPAEKAEQASWRVNEAHRFAVEPGFVLLAMVPAPPDRPGGWSMLLLAHDARDGTGSRLLGAWWLGAQAPAKPAAAFGWFVGRFGVPLRDGGREGLFYFHTPSPVPPQPAWQPGWRGAARDIADPTVRRPGRLGLVLRHRHEKAPGLPPRDLLSRRPIARRKPDIQIQVLSNGPGRLWPFPGSRDYADRHHDVTPCPEIGAACVVR